MRHMTWHFCPRSVCMVLFCNLLTRVDTFARKFERFSNRSECQQLPMRNVSVSFGNYGVAGMGGCCSPFAIWWGRSFMEVTNILPRSPGKNIEAVLFALVCCQRCPRCTWVNLGNVALARTLFIKVSCHFFHGIVWIVLVSCAVVIGWRTGCCKLTFITRKADWFVDSAFWRPSKMSSQPAPVTSPFEKALLPLSLEKLRKLATSRFGTSKLEWTSGCF